MSVDTSKSPQRIWAAVVKQGYGEWQDATDGLPKPVEYVRADLYDALLAERDALIHDIERAKESESALLADLEEARVRGAE